MPYGIYRLHQIEHAKSPAEIRHADENAARVCSAVSSLFHAITAAGTSRLARSLAGARAAERCLTLPQLA
jgi:hypothetical protein